MRPFGTSEQLARRRQRALELLHHGQPPTKVAKRMVERQGVPAVYPPLNRRLVSVLKRGAYAYGYAEAYWTLDRIAHLIWDLFRVRYL